MHPMVFDSKFRIRLALVFKQTICLYTRDSWAINCEIINRINKKTKNPTITVFKRA